MKNGKLIQRYNDQLDSFRRHFAETAEGNRSENIHQLRVAIKKIRALLTLMEIASDHRFDKEDHFALFSGIFSRSGKVREAQINLSLIAIYHNSNALTAYAEYLAQRQQKQTLKLNAELQTFDFARLEELNQLILEQMEQIQDKDVLKEATSFVLDKLKKVKVLKNKTADDDKLHGIRIRLKAVSEILALLHELKPSFVKNRTQQKFKSLNKMIGKWHDDQVLIVSLKKFIHKHPEQSELTDLKKIRKQFKEHNQKARKKIYQLLDKEIEIDQLKFHF